MKLTVTRVLTPLAALAIAFGTQAALPANDGFESGAKDGAWTFEAGADGAEDLSTVADYGEAAKPGNRPDAFKNEANAKYLELSTEDGVLLRQVDGGAVKALEKNLFLDTVVQFTVTAESDRPTPSASDKFIIWLEAKEANESDPASTNLCVYGGYVGKDGDDNVKITKKRPYKLQEASGLDLNIQPGSWHRLTVKAAADIFPATQGVDVPGFQIYIDGRKTSAVPLDVLGDGSYAAFWDTGNVTIDDQPDDEYGVYTIIPSMVKAAELQYVGFSGEGKVDDVVITEELPDVFPHHAVTFTWDTTMVTSVSINGTSYTGGTATLNLEPGSVVTLTKSDFYFVGGNANRYQFDTWTADTGLDVADVEQDVSRQITIGGAGTVNLAFIQDTKVKLSLDVTALDWDKVTKFTCQVGGGDPKDLNIEEFIYGTLIELDVEAGKTVVFDLQLSEAFDMAITTEATGVTASGLTLTVGEKVVDNFNATLTLTKPAPKVFKVGEAVFTLDQIADAVAASSEASPLTLMDNVELTKAIDVGETANAVIDLAGYTLTGAAAADVFTVAGTLTIVNSTPDQGGVTAGQDGWIAADVAGTLTIAGAATYTGTIATTAGTINISAGKFSADVPSATFADGYDLTENQETHLWEYGVITYTITFNGNGAEGAMDQMTYNITTETFTLTAVGFTVPDGKKFDGWATSAEGEVVYADGAEIKQGSTGNLDLYAIWSTAEEPSTPVAPGASEAAEYDTEEAAQAAAATVVITPTAEVAEVLKDVAAYKALFTVQTVKQGDKWVNTVVLTDKAAADLQTQVDTAAKNEVNVAAIAAGTATKVTITATPGLYYTIKSGTKLGALTAGTKVLATSTEVELPVANLGATGFYQVMVDVVK